MAILSRFPDMDQRLKGEFDYLVNKYPHIAFNMCTWAGIPNSPDKGKRFLLATECRANIIENYEPETIKKYEGFLTHNRKFKELHPKLNVIITNGPIKTDDYYYLEPGEFLSFDQKIRGVCAMLKMYRSWQPEDILDLREKFFENLNIEPRLVAHTYGPVPWGGNNRYQGFIDKKHSHYDHLKRMNEYLFCWCPEPIYHPIWSYDWITERLFNCFKSKVIPIYYGCYNLEEYIPLEFVIDFRKFNFDYKLLADFLVELSHDESRYTDMVESAYTWNLTNKFGDIEGLEKLLESLK
jgi:hypothetical protein